MNGLGNCRVYKMVILNVEFLHDLHLQGVKVNIEWE